MKGILYGVGVGPGDPELMTLKAVRLIQENEIIALPGREPCATTAYQIAMQAVPELAKKILLPLPMPMVMDREVMARSHRENADHIEAYLKQGNNIVFLTLGDPTIYSTFLYMQKQIHARGYETELVSGVPSFCAAAARAKLSLAEWEEPLHVIPAAQMLHHPHGESYCPADLDASDVSSADFLSLLKLPGNCVLMKSASKMSEMKKILQESGREVVMVENCGMPDEKIYRSIEDIPDDAGYYSLIIAKKNL